MTQTPNTLILTHEHADFDAVASLLAASIITPNVQPVLPRLVNRNVRGFLALYGPDLPLIEYDDAPTRDIERVMLVDTQNLPALRGIDRDIAVTVIDHHPAPDQQMSGWTYVTDHVGATTTLLVEMIAERPIVLTPAQATLLLLGIYEDTGSLSYADTTARDAHAVAYLLEHGVNLIHVREFLHHPLSDAQRTLYDQLREASQSHEIQGRTIVLAATRSEEHVDEISTVTQRLRDLLEPDAIFVLVAMDSSIQVVARSQVDAIDVGAICEALGGGGHSRAAAALVRDRDLNALRDQLLDSLQHTTRAVVSVRQIMSRGGQTLDAEASIAEAGKRMQRTGFEGYPVLRDGKVVGLLTRRAVDRALSHKLGRHPVASIMEEGYVAVSPDDPVEKLQRLMITNGWGQVAVVDKDEQVVGIVTRTDVLKLWDTHPQTTRRTDIIARLEHHLDPQLLTLIRDIAATASAEGYSIFFVGGIVRDLLLDRPLYDVDLVVEGDAIALARHMAREKGGRVTSHARFGTAKWILDQNTLSIPTPDELDLRTLDFVTARTEFYAHPTALPQVERSSIKQDLHRRDFTINSMAVCLDPDRFGELIDFYSGERDLRDGVIRVLHSLSFVDDPTRMLRAARFEQRFGFQIDPRTHDLLIGALDLLDRVSGARIRNEFDLIFLETQPEKMIERLADLGVLAKVHQELMYEAWLAQKYADARAQNTNDLAFSYLALLVCRLDATALNEFAQRLRYPQPVQIDLRSVRLLHETESHIGAARKASEVYRFLHTHSSRALRAAQLASDDANARANIERFIWELALIKPSVDGAFLKSLGLRPGPLYGRILNALRDALLDGEIASRAEEESFVHKLLANEETTLEEGEQTT